MCPAGACRLSESRDVPGRAPSRATPLQTDAFICPDSSPRHAARRLLQSDSVLTAPIRSRWTLRARGISGEAIQALSLHRSRRTPAAHGAHLAPAATGPAPRAPRPPTGPRDGGGALPGGRRKRAVRVESTGTPSSPCPWRARRQPETRSETEQRATGHSACGFIQPRRSFARRASGCRAASGR